MSYVDLSGKCFIITGAGSGMGRATALRFTSQGANVGLLDICEPLHVAKEIQAANKGQCVAVQCDVTDAAAVDSAVETVTQRFGQLHGAANMTGWVGNQGIHGKAYGFDVITDADWDSVVKVNLDGVKNCIRAELQHMNGAGSVVNAASIAGQFGPPWSGPYSVAKWGVISITKCAAHENGHRNIRVDAVAPGVIDTPLVESLGDSQSVHDALLSRTALKRIGQPEEVSNLITFLLSDQASYITSTVVNIEAGYQ